MAKNESVAFVLESMNKEKTWKDEARERVTLKHLAGNGVSLIDSEGKPNKVAVMALAKSRAFNENVNFAEELGTETLSEIKEEFENNQE